MFCLTENVANSNQRCEKATEIEQGLVMSVPSFQERLDSQKILLLDGATGTELERRGFKLQSPAWSAAAIEDAPELLQQIHQDYSQAGAELITANTFRTHPRNLRGVNWERKAKELTVKAVEMARSAIPESSYVAGSIAPLEDCYSPELTPCEAELEEEHGRMVQNLVEANVDVLLIETQITIREAVIAAKACSRTRTQFLISWTCDRDGNLLSGESLIAATREILKFSPAAVLVNCIPVDEVQKCLYQLRDLDDNLRLGCYANTGRLMPDGNWESTAGENPAVYAEFVEQWKEFGIAVVGGCCGTSPQHISHISQMLYDD